jgi:hypothetical protein
MLEHSVMGPYRAAARLLTLLLLVALLAGCESAGQSRTVQLSERPHWTAGESWTYRGKGRDGAYTITRRVLREGSRRDARGQAATGATGAKQLG